MDEKIKEIYSIIEKNKYGYLQKIKARPDLIKFIEENTVFLNDPYFKLSTKIFCVIHKISEFPKCKECGKEIRKNIRNIYFGFNDFCSSKCANRNEKIKNKIENTKISRYGSKSYSNQEKREQTCLEKYGSKTYNNRNKFKKTISNFSDERKETINEKRKNTCLKKYGVSNINKLQSIREKTAETCFNKYGKKCCLSNNEIRKKITQTMIKKYGCENPNQNFDIQEKIKKTNLERYGCENPSQNRKIRLKQQSKYFFENKHFDSSPEIALYIYLLDNNIDFEYQPDVSFEYLDENSKIHKYFPDFKIEDKYYEIKGDHFFNKNNELIFVYGKNKGKHDIYKQQCMKDNNVIILRSKDYQKYLDYVTKIYGKNYLKQFRNKTS